MQTITETLYWGRFRGKKVQAGNKARGNYEEGKHICQGAVMLFRCQQVGDIPYLPQRKKPDTICDADIGSVNEGRTG